MLLSKKTLGWSILGKFYRIRRPIMVIAFYMIDTFGSILRVFKKRRIKKEPKEILVIQLDHIGDMLINTSLLSDIKKYYPNAKLSVLIRTLAKPVATYIDSIDEIICFDTPWLSREKHLSWIETLKFCFKNFKKYDLSFEVHGDPRNIFLAFALSKFSIGTGTRGLGFLLNQDIGWGREHDVHIVEMQNRMLKGVLQKDIDPSPTSLDIPDEINNNVQSLLKDNKVNIGEYYLIQMSVGEVNREWPNEYWKELVEKLLKEDKQIVCADLNKEKIEAIRPPKELINNFFEFSVSLVEYTAIVKNAKAVISVETFCNHVASCFETPSIAIYSGVTFTDEWAPYMKKKQLLQDSSCELFPCALRICPFEYPSPCLKSISVEEVYKSVNDSV